MRFITKDTKDLVVGSLWKYVAWDTRQEPNRTSENQDFTISRVHENHVRFGRLHEPNRHEFRTERFLSDLVPIKDPLIKLKTQLFSAISPIRGCPDVWEEFQKLLVEMDI